MSADLIIEEVIARLSRRFGRPRRAAKARVFAFGGAVACSVNYSKLLQGNKYFFGLPAAFLDPRQNIGKAQLGEFAMLICGSPENVLVLPRTFLVEMMQGVTSRRLDVFVDSGTYVLQTTKHPKCDVTHYLNAFPRRDVLEPKHPQADEEEDGQRPDRIHLKVQFALVALGRAEGCSVWVPIADRNLSYRQRALADATLSRLPNFGFDENTRRIVQNIDVLWLSKNVISKAFEIESTTAIYSGLLRLNDLALVQPNVQIQLYVAAAKARRERVYNQFLRPSFQTLLRQCEFISFEQILEQAEYLVHVPIASGARVSGLIRGERFTLPEHFLYPEHV
jgi:hypothetical protein